jgi:uncharacterized membrane protein YeaQ/YmgE (transglycosylase-associated protein family)
MSILGWIVLGAVPGWIGSMLINKAGEGLFLDIVLGIAGTVGGACYFAASGSTGVTGFNVRSLFVAVVGAVVVLALYHALTRRTIP